MKTTMKQKTWPLRSSTSRFSSFPLPSFNSAKNHEQLYVLESSSTKKSATSKATAKSSPYLARSIRFCSRPLSVSPARSESSSDGANFSALPYDILLKIAASFNHPNLQAASLVCRSWSEGLRPLREAMLLLRWGKRFKHGRDGVRPNIEKALDSFTKAAARGSALAMVDAGLIYWEMGKKEKAMALYQKAAELGDPSGQCNLGISYLQSIHQILKFRIACSYCFLGVYKPGVASIFAAAFIFPVFRDLPCTLLWLLGSHFHF